MKYLYHIWLLLVFGEGNPEINNLLSRFGSPENIYNAFIDNTAAFGSAINRKAEKITLKEAEDILSDILRKGIKIISSYDTLYPKALHGTDNAPCLLFIKGNADILSGNLLTIVGSRAVTEAAYKMQSKVCDELFRRFTPVTTLSDGCDTLTCMTAVRRHKPVVIVMPCGLDSIYPKDALVLREEVLRAGGCLVTEYFPERAAVQGRFQRRARILGGISKATLVTQVGKDSGAILTAEYSPAPFFLPPPDIFNKSYAGTAGCIRRGGKLYFGITDIEKAYRSDYVPQMLMSAYKDEEETEKETAPEKPEADGKAEKPPREKLSPEDFETPAHYSAYLAIYGSETALTFDEILYKTDTDLNTLCEILLDLEIDGIVTVIAGSKYRLA